MKSSIRNKLIVLLLCATIIPISTSVIISYFFTKQSVQSEMIRSNSDLLFQGKTNINNYLDVLNQFSLSIYTDPRSGSFGSMFEIIEEGKTDYLSNKEIYRYLQFLAASVGEIHQIYLYLAKANSSHLYVNGNLTFGESDPKFHPKVEPGQVYVEPNHMSHNYGLHPRAFEIYPSKPVITFHRSIYDVPTGQFLGLLSIDIRMDRIDKIAQQLFKPDDEQLYIIDREGALIYSSEPNSSETLIQEEWVNELLQSKTSKGNITAESKSFRGIQIYDKMRTTYAEWTIVKRTPYHILFQNARQLALINTLVFIAFLIVAVAATLYISFRFTAPIKTLIGHITKIQTGNLHADIEMNRQDEFGILAKRFNSMMQTINNLILREYRLEISNKTNQLKMLQAQINPHFLNNALQSIGTLALHYKADKVYLLISSLGKMMRYGMDTNETVVPLAKEIDHVKAYLELQKQRFDEKLKITFNMDPSLSSVIVPKMILQPLVENYFKHGFDAGQKDGELRITCVETEADAGFLKIIIEDNGKGMNPERLTNIQGRLLGSAGVDLPELLDGIGLMNVLTRLRLYFNESAKMTIEPILPSGLKVTLWIPVSGRKSE
ncbi:MAG TPA: sensor histidine kinase [Bacilli bacterium]